MRFLPAALCGVVSFLGICGAQAQPYPSRPITLVVPFAAGGPTDTLARILGERMRQSLGQTIVVEATTGAAGAIGAGRVPRAAPDGYTIGIGHVGTHVVNGAIYPLGYDLLKDLDPIALLPANPQLIVTKPNVPAKDLKELIACTKENQAKITGGTAGNGSASHVAAIYFQQKTATNYTLVPYRGTGPAILDLIAGQIDLMIDQASNSLPHVQGGKLRAFAVTAAKPLPSAPDIPSVDEAGLPGFYISIWHGLWVPHGTPKEAIERLTAAAQDALADPAVQRRLADLGLEIPPRERQTPEGLRAHQIAEIEKWWPIIKAANIKGE